MRAVRTFAALVVSLAVTGGVLAACQLAGYAQPTVSLRVRGNVADAQVTIDDIPVGALGFVQARGVTLPPGKHRVTIEQSGYFPWDAVVKTKDKPVMLQIALVPVPD